MILKEIIPLTWMFTIIHNIEGNDIISDVSQALQTLDTHFVDKLFFAVVFVL